LTVKWGLTFENAALVSGGKGEKNTGCFTEFGKGQLGSPDLFLATETVGTNETKPKETRTIKIRSFSNTSGDLARQECQGSTYSLISFSFSKGRLGVSAVDFSVK